MGGGFGASRIQDRRENNCVAEAHLLAKYEDLPSVHDSVCEKRISIYGENMEFWSGRDNEWMVIGVCADESVNNEPFILEVACKCIGETPLMDGVQVIHQGVQEGE